MKGNRKDWKQSGVYCITCVVNNKKYIGASTNIYSRINNHKYNLEKSNRKGENQSFIDDWHKFGKDAFTYIVLEYTDKNLNDRESYYMLKYNTIDSDFGYNLRRDTSLKKNIVSEETKKRYSEAQKKRMENIAHKNRAVRGIRNYWKNNFEKLEEMKKVVSYKNTKYRIQQFTKSGELIKTWDTVLCILNENPEYKRHNIYAVCSGEKPTMYGYIWKKCKI